MSRLTLLKYDFHIFKVMRDGQIYNRLMSNFLWMSAPITIKIELFFTELFKKVKMGNVLRQYIMTSHSLI